MINFTFALKIQWRFSRKHTIYSNVYNLTDIYIIHPKSQIRKHEQNVIAFSELSYCHVWRGRLVHCLTKPWQQPANSPHADLSIDLLSSAWGGKMKCVTHTPLPEQSKSSVPPSSFSWRHLRLSEVDVGRWNNQWSVDGQDFNEMTKQFFTSFLQSV